MKLLQQVNTLFEAKYNAPRGVLDTKLIVTPEHLRQARGNKFQVVVKMHPGDFLKLTTSENHGAEYFQQHCKNLEDYNRWAEEGENIIMPGLWIKGDTVTGHEGRHRAAALLCAGEREMAVALKLDPTEKHQEKYGYWEAPYQIKWEDYPSAIHGQYGKGIVMKFDMNIIVDGWDNLVQKNVMEAQYAHEPHTVADQYNHFGREMNYGDLRHGDDTEMWVKDSGVTGNTAWVIVYVEADNEKQAVSRVIHYLKEFNLPYSNVTVPGQFGTPEAVQQNTGFEGMWLVNVVYQR